MSILSMVLHFTGFFCIRFPESMLEPEIKQLYNSWLTKDFGSMKKIEVMIDSSIIETVYVYT